MKKTFEEALGNFKVEDIAKIYSGADNACRCGCSGKYYYKGSKTFKRILANTKKAFTTFNEFIEKFPHEEYLKGRYEEKTDRSCSWINIPVVHANNKCYTIYFIEKEPEISNVD